MTFDGLTLEPAIRDAARVRLRPILMTTLCTLFGLLPLALGLGAGSELQRPLALAVIGGLALSRPHFREVEHSQVPELVQGVLAVYLLCFLFCACMKKRDRSVNEK